MADSECAIFKQNITKNLYEWRARRAQNDGVELFMILHNKTIEEIAEKMPRNEEDFKAIKGLGGKKFEKYGKEILEIVNGSDTSIGKEDSEDDVLSVSKFLDTVNSRLSSLSTKVKGEISSIDIRQHYLFFTLKDKDDESALPCFMWSRNYQICGVELEEGLEVIVHGKPEIYKPAGRFSLQADTVELVGEGALKRAYDELKKKLEKEGIFDVSKKRDIPTLPEKIGLITSREGAVIHDFGNNLGSFGFKTKFYNSRVEGMLAVKQLSEAIRYFKNKDIDVLVIIRGGGSLESLQAFNNESLIREITDYPVPVLCGIGHDKDVPLFSMAADKQFSTPTAVAKEINKSWEELSYKIFNYQNNIFNSYNNVLNDNKIKVSDYLGDLKSHFNSINKKLADFNRIIRDIFNAYKSIIFGMKQDIDRLGNNVINSYSNILDNQKLILENAVKLLKINNPNRQLKLGYSILFSEGKVIKSVSQVKPKQEIVNRVIDGKIISKIKDIKKKENDG